MATTTEIRQHLIQCGFNYTMVDFFMAYHKKNRQLWMLYQQKAFELINKGATRLSSKAIFEKLREDADLKTISTDFKLTNTYTSIYSRVFAYVHPEYANLFEFKQVGKIAA